MTSTPTVAGWTPGSDWVSLRVTEASSPPWRSAFVMRFPMTWCSRSESPMVTGIERVWLDRDTERPGKPALAFSTAAIPRSSRSTGSRRIGRPSSMRTRVSRSSTSRLIRPASEEMRSMTMSASSVAPDLYRSAYPRTLVSGVRSSWEASPMKRRIADSASRACFSERLVAMNAPWIWASIRLSAPERRPTSVFGDHSGTRSSSCPFAMRPAVRSTRYSGCRARRTR